MGRCGSADGYPVEIWEQFGFSQEVYEFFDSDYARIPTPGGHNNTKHGIKTGYSGYVQAELRSDLKQFMRGKTSGELSVQEQMYFARTFVDKIKSGKCSKVFIREFNKHAEEGPAAVLNWYNRRGVNLPDYDDVAEVKITGIAVRSRGQFQKYFKPLLGRSAKMLPFVSAMFVYNEARANGNSPTDAAIIAGLEEINPCPVGYSEFYAAGAAYQDMVERARQTNRERFERILEIQNGGPIPDNAGGR